MIKRLMKRVTRVSMWGAAVGAVVYFFDPRSGRGRRSRTKDQLQAKLRRTSEQADRAVAHVEDKVEGFSQAASQPAPDAPAGDAPADAKTLADKVRSEVLGRAEFAGKDIVIDAAGGVVALRGELETSQEIDELAAAVEAVPGVNKVDNLLHLPGEPAPNKQESLEN